ncbi:MAG: cold-shock protein [Nocardioidaceae bacterium]|nr:cold-shock protein [Nocardioidaceae bacterium]
MQGTVLTFDPDSGAGSVVLDSGEALTFSAEVFAASRLRLLRPGQRVRLQVLDDRDNRQMSAITILTLPDPS